MPRLSAWLSTQRHAHGPALTIYDALKLTALVLMTIDHVGEYFFPDMLWWRAIGRLSFPFWFFLAGYARNQSIPRTLWLWAGLMALSYPLTFTPFFPMNALVSIILCRLFVGLLERRDWLRRYPAEIGAFCLVFYLPASMIFAYGTQALAYAALGAMARLQYQDRPMRLFSAFCLWLYVLPQMLVDFTMPQMAVMIIGVAAITHYLLFFKNRPLLGGQNAVIGGLRILARHTMLYYVVHHVLLQVIRAIGYWGKAHI